MLLCCGTMCGGGVQEGTMPLAWLSAGFQPLPQLPISKLGSSGADSQVGGFMYVLGPHGSPQELSCKVGSFSRCLNSHRFWGFISPHWNPGLHGLSCSLIVPPALSAHKCGTTWSSNCCLAMCPLCPSCLSPSLLPVWMNVSSLTPCWTLYSSIFWQFCFFLFLNLLLSSFWLCNEAKCIYLMPLSWPEVLSLFFFFHVD